MVESAEVCFFFQLLGGRLLFSETTIVSTMTGLVSVRHIVATGTAAQLGAVIVSSGTLMAMVLVPRIASQKAGTDNKEQNANNSQSTLHFNFTYRFYGSIFLS